MFLINVSRNSYNSDSNAIAKEIVFLRITRTRLFLLNYTWFYFPDIIAGSNRPSKLPRSHISTRNFSVRVFLSELSTNVFPTSTSLISHFFQSVHTIATCRNFDKNSPFAFALFLPAELIGAFLARISFLGKVTFVIVNRETLFDFVKIIPTCNIHVIFIFKVS